MHNTCERKPQRRNPTLTLTLHAQHRREEAAATERNDGPSEASAQQRGKCNANTDSNSNTVKLTLNKEQVVGACIVVESGGGEGLESETTIATHTVRGMQPSLRA